MKKSTQKVLDPKKDVLTRLKHLRALLGEARAGAQEVRARVKAGMPRPWGVGGERGVRPTLLGSVLFPRKRALPCRPSV